jgi:thymidylate synthase (FAD)
VKKVDVLNDGFVRLEHCSPENPELMIVNAARESLALRKGQLDDKDRALIKFLTKNRHGTPFEMVDFCFQIRLPIHVAREWMRHRIASYNEVSGRYVRLAGEFFVPKKGTLRTNSSRYGMEPITDETLENDLIEEMRIAYWQSNKHYDSLLEKGLCKEQARCVLPLGIYTEFFFKTNARSLMNFLSLRNAPNAMWEIQEYARVIEQMFGTYLPNTLEAFVENGRMAP